MVGRAPALLGVRDSDRTLEPTEHAANADRCVLGRPDSAAIGTSSVLALAVAGALRPRSVILNRVLSNPRVVAGAADLVALLVYYRVVGSLPEIPTWADVVFTAFVLTPAVFLLVLLALPLMRARGLLAIGLATALLAFVLVEAELDVLGNFAKLAAVTLLAFWFLDFFEELSWVVIVACVIPVVDAFSVWRGPTRHIVEERPEVFGALSFAFPVPGEGAFQLGLPDLLFFAIFLGAASRWDLRLLATWACLVASFGLTMALAIYVDPFGIGGLPALPLLCIAFLAPNADLIWRRLRDEKRRRDEEPDAEPTK